jgi:hypothetical protein
MQKFYPPLLVGVFGALFWAVTTAAAATQCSEKGQCFVLFDSIYPAAYSGMKQNADVFVSSTGEYVKFRWLHEYALATVTQKKDGNYSCYITTAADYELPCSGLIDNPATFFTAQ